MLRKLGVKQPMPNWVILQITSQKKTDFKMPDAMESKQHYFEMCDLDGKKVAGAATIPIPETSELGGFRTVILSTLEPNEVVGILKRAGAEL